MEMMMTTDTAIDATLPPLAEAMTARDLMAWERALTKQFGGSKVAITIGIGFGSSDAYVSVRPDGFTGSAKTVWFEGATFPEAILAAQTWIANRPKVERNATIRKLALAVIECTDEHGKCTVAHLRAKGFDSDEIALHAEACQRAGEMAGNVPFSVEGV
jgi:hypothetical protein